MQQIENIETSSLTPHPKNLEIYGETQNVEDLVEDIRERGVILCNLIIDQDNQIIDGVRRWMSATQLSMETVPCERKTYETIEEVIADIISYSKQRIKTSEQLYKLGKELKKIYAAEARLITLSRLEQNQSTDGLTASPTVGRTADRIGEDIGLSSATWKRLEYVLDKEIDFPEISQKLISGQVSPYRAYNMVRDKERKTEDLEEKQIKFLSIIEGIERQSLRELLLQRYSSLETVRKTKESDLRKEIWRSLGTPVDETFREMWADTSKAIRKMVDEIALSKDHYLVNVWSDPDTDRNYIQCLLWMDEGDGVPNLIREPYLERNFADFTEADEFARKRGGYCQGIYKYADDRRYWILWIHRDYVEEKKEEEEEQ